MAAPLFAQLALPAAPLRKRPPMPLKTGTMNELLSLRVPPLVAWPSYVSPLDEYGRAIVLANARLIEADLLRTYDRYFAHLVLRPPARIS